MRKEFVIILLFFFLFSICYAEIQVNEQDPDYPVEFKQGRKGFFEKDEGNYVRVYDGIEINGLLFSVNFTLSDIFDQNFENNPKLSITPRDGKVIIKLKEGTLFFEAKGDSKIEVDSDSILLKGRDVSNELGELLLNKFHLPVEVSIKNSEGKLIGSFKSDYNQEIKQTKLVEISGKTYSLNVGEVYLMTEMHENAFSKATTPSIDSERIQHFSYELQEDLIKLSHLAILYVDNDGSVWVTESMPEGVIKILYELSRFYNNTDKVKRVYSFADADHEKIISKIKKNDEKEIGWFLFDSISFLDVFILNKYKGNDYKLYRGCLGYVNMIVKYGNVDLRKNAEYVELRGNDAENFVGYIKGLDWFDEKDVLFVSKALNFLGFYADKVGILRNFFGLSPGYFLVTPSQILLGNLNKGIIEPVEPISS